MSGYVPGLALYPSDKVCKALVGGIEQLAEPPRRGVFQRAIDQWRTRWLIAILYTIIALVSLITLWYSNGFIDWMFYWMLAVGALLLQVFLLGSIWYLRRQERRAPGGISSPGQVSIRSLTRGALAGDDNLAPPITIYPGRQITQSPDAPALSFKVMTPGSRLLRNQQIAYGINLCLGVGIVAMWVALFFVARTLLAQNFFPWQMYALVALFPIVSGMWFVSITRKVRAIQVEARGDGLHWGKHTLPWSETRGWFAFAMNPASMSSPQPNIVFALVGERASLIWLSYPPYARTGEPGQLLAQLVQEHVNLPLRDLNPGAVRISSEVVELPPWRRPRLLAASARHMGETALPRWPTAIGAAALSVLVLLGGILTPYAQQWYFGGQLNRMETATSHISDPLTANTLDWTLTSPDAAKGVSFTPSGYVFSSDTCCNTGSLIPQVMHDGLVEVTMRQQVDFDLNDAGILFRANSASNTALAFTITPNGEWHLDLLPKQGDGPESDYRSLRYEGDFGGIAAIHQGLDATNRLAVLMQGTTCTFFVNGQYVGSYRGDDVPQSGQVGVFVGGSNGTITFSDLLISPA